MDCISPAELGVILGGAKHDTVLEWRRQYGWPCVRIGKRILFTPDQVDRIVASHSVTPNRGAKAERAAVTGQTPRSAGRKKAA